MFKRLKRPVVLSILFCAAMMLNACSGTTTDTEKTAPERVLTDALGHEVKVPAQPQRIIASYLEDHLVALGVRPVAQWSVGGQSVQAYLQGELAGIPPIPSDLPYEAVMSFSPDLIIMGSADMVAGDKYDQYAKIAPTYTVGTEKNNDWRQVLLKVGEVLGKSEEAKNVLAAYEAKASEAREKLKQAAQGKKAAALWVTASSVYVVNEKLSSGDVLYKDLGLTPPDAVREASRSSDNNWIQLSLEKLAEMDADYLFVVNSKGVSKEQLLQDPVWAGIPAVKNNQVYAFDRSSSWLYSGPIASGRIIDDVLGSVLQ